MSERFPTLARLVAPTPVSDFIASYWETRVLHVPSAGGDALVSLEDIDAALAARPHRHPVVVLADAANAVEPEEYADDQDIIDPVRLVKRFNAGATIIMNRLDESVPKVRALCSALEAELGILVQANLYLTPYGAQGFPIHWDSHDVIVVQCEGRKHWRIYGAVPLPMRGEQFTAGATPPGEVVQELVLEPGDALYIPRGVMHDAVAADDGLSLHVPVGFHAVRWSEVLIEAIAAAALEDPALRRGVDLGALVGDPDAGLDATLREHATRALSRVSWDLVRERVREEYLREHKQGLDGLLVGSVTDIDVDTPLARRAGIRVELRDAEDGVIVSVQGRTSRWPAHARPALEAALSAERFTLSELGDALDAKGWVTLARRLLAEGALRIDRDA
ncbi:MAG: cupin domain-containing protein [Polyangiales bacterium]